MKAGKSIDDIAVEIIEILMSHRQKENFDLQKLLSDENIKENVYFRIINKKRNKELLKDVPHMTYESLAMIIAINVNNLVKDEDEGEASIVIHNIHMDGYIIRKKNCLHLQNRIHQDFFRYGGNPYKNCFRHFRLVKQ